MTEAALWSITARGYIPTTVIVPRDWDAERVASFARIAQDDRLHGDDDYPAPRSAIIIDHVERRDSCWVAAEVLA